MRLTSEQIGKIREIVHRQAGARTEVRLFGSRLDDNARGGDVDLYVELADEVDEPAMLAARIAAQVSRQMRGRKVDVLLAAPNLKRLPIHDVAHREGRLL